MIPDAFLTLALRFDQRRRLFPEGTVCACGEDRAVVFVEETSPVCCYECDREHRGLPRWEEHHLGGQPSPLPAVLILANLHRVLSDLQDVFWRKSFAPGLAEAVWFDLEALLAVGSLWLGEE